MKIFNISLLIISSIYIVSCSEVIDSSGNKNRKIDPGNIPINYYADKTVKSLVVPPDLTKPNSQNSFRISEYVSNVNENIVNFSDSETAKDTNTKILAKNSDISVERAGQRRWLVINKNSDIVWELTKDFIKRQGFSIKKSDKKIGIIETDFLENYPEIPEQSLGFFRSMLSKALTARYTLPIIDKYRIRIEPITEDKTELHLSLFSMQEKLAKSGNVESTIWESYEKDYSLETEMLYRLMVFISGDQAGAREKILKASEKKRY
jgi:outer membrane protein assembly factor BamC